MFSGSGEKLARLCLSCEVVYGRLGHILKITGRYGNYNEKQTFPHLFFQESAMIVKNPQSSIYHHHCQTLLNPLAAINLTPVVLTCSSPLLCSCSVRVIITCWPETPGCDSKPWWTRCGASFYVQSHQPLPAAVNRRLILTAGWKASAVKRLHKSGGVSFSTSLGCFVQQN